MNNFFELLCSPSYTIANIPAPTLLSVAVIITLSLLLRQLMSLLIIRYLKRLAARTTTSLDDNLLDVMEAPLGYLVILAGMVVSRLLLVAYVNPSVDKTLNALLQFCFVLVLCWTFYRSAEVLTTFFERFTVRTKTELDDLLLPYATKVIKIIAIIIVFLKAAELFLGMSAASLLGLLGGMGLTLGLVFKDIIANWFGCAIIYIDNLFREGDWVQLDDGKIVDADVECIGIRSTKFRNFDKTVSIVPNATIAAGVIKNWSRMYKRRVKYSFRIDGIASDALERVLTGLRAILAEDPGVHQEFHMVNFREVEGNGRIIRLYYFTKSTVWKEHEQVREAVNLKILKLFETEGIQRLAYTAVDLSDDRPHEIKING